MGYLSVFINRLSVSKQRWLKRKLGLMGTLTALAGTITVLLLSSCNFSNRVLSVPIPDRDIVFQTCVYMVCEQDELGFVNADGSEPVYIEHTPLDIYEPQWAGVNNDCLLITHAQGRLSCINSAGKLSRIRPKESLGNASPIPGKDETYIVRASEDSPKTELHRIDLKTGDFLQTFPSEDGWRIDIGANTEANGVVVYSRTRYDNRNWSHETELIISDIESTNERVLLHNAIEDPVADSSILNPAISPDGQWIAYTYTDGIHLIRPNGSDDKLLVSVPDWNQYWPVFTWAPKPSWSPDSQWIVYHVCLNENCTVTDKQGSAIYKTNVETQETILLLYGGINPYWKLID